jgi:glycosyltransferase involved in cell wall biosynthesis
VDLAHGSPEVMFGRDGPVELAECDPLSIAAAIELLLDDEQRWHRRSQAGVAYVADATWEHAAGQVEAGLRAALRERELAAPGALR